MNSHDRKKICLISGLGLRNLIKLFFSYLRQVILLEEFNDCVSQDLKTDLEDNNSKTLEEAAVISDTLTHSHEKNFFTRPQNSNYSSSSYSYNKSVLKSQSSISSHSSPQGGSRSSFGRFEGSSGI